MPARINLADLHRQLGRDADATLRAALALRPDDAGAQHALGLALVRRARWPRPLPHLQAAGSQTPQDAPYAYVYGMALNSAGRSGEALAVLRLATSATLPPPGPGRAPCVTRRRTTQMRWRSRECWVCHDPDPRCLAACGTLC